MPQLVAAGGGARASRRGANIAAMQLFHELKQQFPALPDHAVSACVAALRRSTMSHSQTQTENEPESETVPPTTTIAQTSPLSSSSSPNAAAASKPPIAPSARTKATRPATLDLPRNEIPNVTAAAAAAAAANTSSSPAAVNLAVNVNCSVDLVPSPPQASAAGQTTRRHSAVLQVTPEQSWLHPSSPASPRSYTSVNLTLRTPTSSPQPPIDICSTPASLTYTTSSFDRRQGVQSRLQITVGPGAGIGSVSAVRTRPRSCYQPQEIREESTSATRGTSMPDLTSTIGESGNNGLLLSRQIERKEQLKNELEAGREKLNVIKKEIQALRLENTPEIRNRLEKEIKHLQSQCKRLTHEVDRHAESRVPLGETNEEFYRHIYTGQRGTLRSRPHRPPAAFEQDEPRWTCHLCTFRNHPLMDKCEQCEMPRLLLVSAGPGENIHIRFSPGNSTRVIHSWVV